MFASSLVLVRGLTAGQLCRGPGEGAVLVHRLALREDGQGRPKTGSHGGLLGAGLMCRGAY